MLLLSTIFLFNKIDTKNEELQIKLNKLPTYENWINSKLSLFLLDSRFSDILPMIEDSVYIQNEFSIIQKRQSETINKISSSIAVMLSSIFDLMEFQRNSLVNDKLSEKQIFYHSTIYSQLQRLFMEIMSANLKIISSRFIVSAESPQNILLTTNSISEQSSLLYNQLTTSEERDIFNTFYKEENLWVININNLLEDDVRKDEIINRINFVVQDILINPNELNLLKVIILIVLPALFLLLIISFVFTVRKNISNEKQTISENHSLQQKIVLLEAEKVDLISNSFQKDKTITELKQQLKKKDQSLIESEQNLSKYRIDFENAKMEAILLKEKNDDLLNNQSNANDPELQSQLEIFSYQFTKSIHSLKTFIEGNITVEGFKDEIKDIKKLINSLEDLFAETRLLSLNAAVESARAGEKGKGFGIVADKIREISEKSQSLSKSLKDSIQCLSEKMLINQNMDKKYVDTLNIKLSELNTSASDILTTTKKFIY